jgi:hypothetical protein
VGWDRPAVHHGVVRLSRAIGLPPPLPDGEGLALRLPGLGAGGAPLDLLVNSAWRYVFAPAALAPAWSALLPHHTASGARVLLGARPHAGGFTLLVASPLGPWRPWGELALGPEVPQEIAFDPTVGADDLRHGELFRRLRRQAYGASQAARGAPAAPAPAAPAAGAAGQLSG